MAPLGNPSVSESESAILTRSCMSMSIRWPLSPSSVPVSDENDVRGPDFM